MNTKRFLAFAYSNDDLQLHIKDQPLLCLAYSPFFHFKVSTIEYIFD